MLIMLFPESPRWLIDHGYSEEGLRTLAKLHSHGDTTNAWVVAEYNQIQDMITFEHDHEAKSYKELFSNKSSFRRLFLAVSIQASVQLTGVSAIQYYSPGEYSFHQKTRHVWNMVELLTVGSSRVVSEYS